jgi:aspartyl-tRNA(Asn)/glutamyl-tRNA(Gln) amidotransferase subunit A
MSVPAGFNQAGLPLGLQVLAKPFDEASIYKVGKVIEDSAAISSMPQRMAGGA